MKKRYLLTSLLSVALLSGALVGAMQSSQPDQVKADAESWVNADVNRFHVRGYTSGSMTPNALDQSITFTGAWDSSFVTTEQFNTESSNFSFRTHVSTSTAVTSGNFGISLFHIFQDHFTSYITFAADGKTIYSFNFLNWVDGSPNILTAAFEGDATFTNYDIFLSLFADNPAKFSDDPAKYVINPSTGFDIQYNLERTTYAGVSCEAISVDMFGFDSVTSEPATLSTKKVYIQWQSKPNANADTHRTAIKPEIGFYSDGITNVKVSDIKFLDRETVEYKTMAKEFGNPTHISTTIDVAGQTVDIDSTHACTSGVLLDNIEGMGHDFDISADISGVGGNEAGTVCGFTIWYDEQNCANYFLEWGQSDLSIPKCLTIHYIVDGNYQNCCRFSRNPWDNSYQTIGNTQYQSPLGEWYGNYTDFGGWSTDSTIDCGAPAASTNFNLIRTDLSGKTVNIGTGFRMGLRKHRVVRLGLLVDEFNLYFSTVDKDGIERVWYSCAIDVDAFTYPLGSQTSSPLINTIPQIGLYAFHNEGITSHATFSNLKFNHQKLSIVAPTGLTVADQSPNFMVGDKFIFDGKVTLNFNDSSFDYELEDDEYSVVGPDDVQMASVGTKDVVVTYLQDSSITKTINVNVVAVTELQSITVSGQKTAYKVGDSFEKPHVVANYSGDYHVNVSESATFAGFDSNKAGKQTITVSYEKAGVTKTFTYDVFLSPAVIDITVKNPQTSYKVGDTFVKPKVVKNFNGGAEDVEIPESDLVFEGFDSSTEGTKTITVSYSCTDGDFYDSYDITVSAVLGGITVQNVKTTYVVGETFSKPNVIASYAGSTAVKNVTQEATFTNNDTSTAGTKTVLVSYTENGVTKSTSYTIEVVAQLDSIVVSNMKTEYKLEEKFVMPTVTAHYVAGKADTDVSTLATASGYKKTVTGKQTITISYTEGEITKTATYEITVKKSGSSVGLIIGIAGGVVAAGAAVVGVVQLKKRKKAVK